MIAYRTDHAMSELADFLEREQEKLGYRDLEDKTKVSRGSLENLINKTNTKFPTMETLEKIATAYGMPLWRVIEMAGLDLGLQQSASDLAQRLTALSNRMPEIAPIVGYLLKLYPDDLRGVLAYLEALDRLRGQDENEAGI